MSACRAPVAMRMPISRVRSRTVISITFMTPMPPTSSEIAAISPSISVSVRLACASCCTACAWFRMLKSFRPWRAVSVFTMAASVSAACRMSRMTTLMRLSSMLPTSRTAAAPTGTST